MTPTLIQGPQGQLNTFRMGSGNTGLPVMLGGQDRSPCLRQPHAGAHRARFDSCPMEAFDKPRVKRLLGLPRAAEIVMVIAAGRRADDGVIPRIRFSREHYTLRA